MMEEESRKNEVARRTAEEASRMKDRFLSFIGHELRTPLNSVLGFAQTIQRLRKRGNINPEREDGLIGNIVSSARHLTGIIEDMLDVARLESGRLRVNLEPLHPAPILDAVYSQLYDSAAQKGLEMTIETEDELPEVIGDRQRLAQVMINLVGNAVKFTEQGHVRIRAGLDREEGYVLFSVEDSGKGIAKDFHDKIFDRFSRAEGSGVLPGAGLGLNISKMLTEMMGGRIWFDQDRTDGAAFYVSLKIWEDKE